MTLDTESFHGDYVVTGITDSVNEKEANTCAIILSNAALTEWNGCLLYTSSRLKRASDVHLLSWKTVKSSGQSTDTAISFFSAAYTIPLMACATDKLDFLFQALVKTSRLETGVIQLDKKPGRLFDTVAQAMSCLLYTSMKPKMVRSDSLR